jgi:hypothetical protein
MIAGMATTMPTTIFKRRARALFAVVKRSIVSPSGLDLFNNLEIIEPCPLQLREIIAGCVGAVQ